jgi:hypothetical protein
MKQYKWIESQEPTLLLFEVPDHTACDTGSFQVEAGRLCCILEML